MSEQYKIIYDSLYKLVKDKNIYNLSLDDANSYVNMKLKQKKNNTTTITDNTNMIIDIFINSLKYRCSEPFHLEENSQKRIIKLYKQGVFPIKVNGLD